MTSKVENISIVPEDSSTVSTSHFNENNESRLAVDVNSEIFVFDVPPEAPVFHPNEEEFKDPLAYINQIRPIAEKTGICKIKPPPNWQPPFAVDVDQLRFTPRIQRLNELEAKTRVKLNFLDQIAKFWELQGSTLRIPVVEKRALDLYSLHRVVQREGGSDVVTKERKWSRIASIMGYPPGKGIGTMLKSHYEKVLYPFDVFVKEKNVAIKNESELPENKPSCSTHNIVTINVLDNQDTVNTKITNDIKPLIKTENELKIKVESKIRMEPTQKIEVKITNEIQIPIKEDVDKREAIIKKVVDKKEVITKKEEDKEDIVTNKEVNIEDIITKKEANTEDLIIKKDVNKEDLIVKKEVNKENVIVNKNVITNKEVDKENVTTKKEVNRKDVITKNEVDKKDNVKNEVVNKNETVEIPEYEQNKELKRLQFYGAGPKMAGYKTNKKLDSHIGYEFDPLAKYVCHNCGRGDVEECMLLCDGCDDSYHTFCLMPPLVEVPRGDWRCPECVAVEVSKPVEAFGFEQAQREYSLQQFGEMADQFKSEYFNMPVHLVPTSVVEKEFWRIVSSIDEDVTVEYGADLHTMDHGSGFPTPASLNLTTGDIEYAYSSWNLNNLPLLEGSVLGYLNADISGMKVPWMYVGMCFATFCWHNEDHWSYSINYLHWGEPKTWYGVPGNKALEFEKTMKAAAPELFESQPDLLHQLVTIMNPNVFMNAGVPVFRTDQHAGEFVVTFPRAYHAGFNQGYNFAEAVNFAPADWLRMGRECVLHYSQWRRFCVFSHDELICKMAAEPDKLNPLIAAATYKDMLLMVDSERKLRKNLLDWGVTNAEREAFELLADDLRQCEVCKTTCFLSALTCSCSKKTLVCLRHYADLCGCPPSRHTLRYRYTLDELPRMLLKLKIKAEAFDIWLNKVRDSLDPGVPSTLALSELKDLLLEAEEKKFPKSDLLVTLSSAIEDAEKCASVIRQLDTSMARTRTRNSVDRKYHLNLEELNLFIGEIDSLACILGEAKLIKNLLNRSNEFETQSKTILHTPLPDCDIEEIKKCLEFGEDVCIELPSLNSMRERLQQANWLSQVTEINKKVNIITIDALRQIISAGENLIPNMYVEKELQKLRRLLTESEQWEERAQAILKRSSVNVMNDIIKLLIDSENLPIHLPTKQILSTALNNLKEWRKNLDDINAAEFYPYIEVVEKLILKGKQIPLSLNDISCLQQYVAAGYSWKDKTSRIFLRKNSTISLMEALSPRSPTNIAAMKTGKIATDDDPRFIVTVDMDPVDVVNTFKKEEEKEITAIKLVRKTNMAKRFSAEPDVKYCVCQQSVSGLMMQCELCRNWFHFTCVNLPKIAIMKIERNFTETALQMGFKDSKFLCPVCCRTKRPRLEAILNLLVSLQKLSIRIPEGEALQCLTERAMTWQDKVKQLLVLEEFKIAMTKLSLLCQKNFEAAARQKTEKIISSELKKAATNPDLQQHVQEIASCSGINSDNYFIGNPSYIFKLSGNRNNSKVTSSQSDDTVDEHAYSLHLPDSENNKDCLVPLSAQAQQQLEDLLIEGDTLEVTLDETFKLWKLLQASRHPIKDIVLMDFDGNNTISTKKDRKHRLDNVEVYKKCKQPKIDLNNKKMTKRITKDSAKNRLNSNSLLRNEELDEMDEDSSEEEDLCAATSCVRPTGQEVDWVQCDGGCEQWFHMACVGLSAQEIDEDEDYICTACSQNSSAFSDLQQSTESQSISNPLSPDSTQPGPSKKEVI